MAGEAVPIRVTNEPLVRPVGLGSNKRRNGAKPVVYGDWLTNVYHDLYIRQEGSNCALWDFALRRLNAFTNFYRAHRRVTYSSPRDDRGYYDYVHIPGGNGITHIAVSPHISRSTLQAVAHRERARIQDGKNGANGFPLSSFFLQDAEADESGKVTRLQAVAVNAHEKKTYMMQIPPRS